MKETTSVKSQYRHVPLLLLLLMMTLGAASVYLFYLNRMTDVPVAWGAPGGSRNAAIAWSSSLFSGLIMPLTAGVLGALIISRRAALRIGILMLGVGAVSAASQLISEYAIYGAYTAPEALPGTGLAAWFTNFAWIFLFSGGLFLLAIFPDGHFFSRGWQTVILICLAFFCLPMLLGAIIETPLTSAFQIPNPFFTSYSVTLYNGLFTIGAAAMLITMVAVLAAVLWRFRASQGRVRQQMKWMLAGVALMAFLVLAGFILSFGFQITAGEIMVNVSLLAPFLGMGVALVRHRLYDIDIIIRRTLLYSVVSAFLALIYFGTVLLLQAAFSDGSARSPIFIVISTLLTVALFAPLRARAQTLIDRRFYREKYNAERILDAFARTARDEVELEQLRKAIHETVAETVQPARFSLWLAEAPAGQTPPVRSKKPRPTRRRSAN